MAKRVTLTDQGISLLASSSEATGQYYWIGYYAMAYVPNLWKNDTVNLPVDECGKVNEGTIGSVSITETDTDQVIPTMTRLTKYGDMIYNIWQGDLNGTGFLQCSSDGSPGGDLFGLTMYNTNIKKHYRYVLDSNGNNTLVTWIEDPAYSDGTMLGKHVYKGTDGYVSSTIPIPAPLYYLGDVTGKTSVDTFFNTLPTFEVTDGSIGNGASQYPYLTVTLKATGNPTLDIPRVSADYRGYTDSQGNPGTWNYGGSPSTPYTTPGTYFDTLEIPYAVDPLLGFDETSWFAADQTFNVSGATATDGIFGEEFWKLHTISNYNRYHAPVSSIGHVLDSDLSNRNMSKLTKFFPISNYKVINTDSGYNANSEVVEVATAIKLTIDIDITPRTLAQGFDDDCAFDEENNIQFFEKYNNPLNPTDALDEYGENIYNSTHSSFKFNRVGLYAVPLRKAPYVIQDNGFSTDPTGQNVELEFQIDPDGEPVLYAVIDWDNTISMSDTGDGLNQFRIEADVNLQSPDGVNDTALVRDATIFYNLYEDDALHWYQNQLIANASTQNAITEIGLEVASIKNLGGKGECCPPPDLSGKFAPLDHTHDFLRNLKDANLKLENGLKGIVTAAEGSTIGGEVYKVGFASVVLGENTSVAGDYSFIGNGIDNYITSDVTKSSILGGQGNYIIGATMYTSILSGYNNYIENAHLSSIGNGNDNYISGAYQSTILSASTSYMDASSIGFIGHSVIIAGYDQVIRGTVGQSAIVAGYSNIIDGSSQAFIGAGTSNYIYGAASYTFIGAGSSNQINGGGSAFASILSGWENSITDSPFTSIISGNGNTMINGASYSIIGAGLSNNIDGGVYSGIFTGSSNYIGVNSHRSVIGGGNTNHIYSVSGSVTYTGEAYDSGIFAGYDNFISGSKSFIGAGQLNAVDAEYAIIGAGYDNYINISGTYGGIVSGRSNYIQESTFAFIGAGEYNYIRNDSNYSSILSGSTNLMYNSAYASILSGEYGDISNASYAVILGGKNTRATIPYEVAHSSGDIKEGVGSRHTMFTQSGYTSPSTSYYISLVADETSSGIQLTPGQGFAGTVTVTGYLPNLSTSSAIAVAGNDVIYHEIHSISGIYTTASQPIFTDLSYDETGYHDGVETSNVASPLSGYALTGTLTLTVTNNSSIALVTGTTGALTPIGQYFTVEGAGLIAGASYNGTYMVISHFGTTGVYVQLPFTVGPSGGGSATPTAAYGSMYTQPHMPSVVDTVLDYRYTRGSLVTTCVAPTQADYPYPTIGFWVDTSGRIQLTINTNELYNHVMGSTVTVPSVTIYLVTGETYWTAKYDLTIIDVNAI